MILTHRFGDSYAVWFDGLIPNRSTLEKILSPRGLRDLGLSDYVDKLVWRRHEMDDQYSWDQSYTYLLSCAMGHSRQTKDSHQPIPIALYLVPPCIKPSYASVKNSLFRGNYSPNELLLLRYGPEGTRSCCRVNRYRQIIAIASGASDSSTSVQLLRLLDRTSFRDLYFRDGREDWRCCLFRREVRFLLERMTTSVERKRLRGYTEVLRNEHGFAIYRIQ